MADPLPGQVLVGVADYIILPVTDTKGDAGPAGLPGPPGPAGPTSPEVAIGVPGIVTGLLPTYPEQAGSYLQGDDSWQPYSNIRIDQLGTPTAPVSLGGQRITNLAMPTAATDGVPRQYVDSAVQVPATHATRHIIAGQDKIPGPTTTLPGLVPPIPNVTTSYLNGTGAFSPLGPVIAGGPAGTPAPTSAILVPSYAAHPDAIWTPMGAFDDHFDSPTLNPKWSYGITTGATAPTKPIIGGSSLSFWVMPVSGSNNVYYDAVLSQALPVSTPFTLSFKLNLACWVDATVLGAGTVGYGQVLFQVYSANGQAYFMIVRQQRYIQASGLAYNETELVIPGSSYVFAGPAGDYEYWRILRTGGATYFFISLDGHNWFNLIGATDAQTGFGANPPVRFMLVAQVMNAGYAYCTMDWIKFTSP